MGAGAIGRHHVRLYREIADVELVGVCDISRAKASEVANPFGVLSYTDHLKLIREMKPDAVTVAVPTEMHASVTCDALRLGCHVLVEKPIAADVDQALQMVRAAESAGRLLMVGHVERYNPAIIELKRRLVAGELGRVFQVHARRLGPFPGRVRDIGVVIDLATHDLDIMRYLTGSEAVRVYAESRREVHSHGEDLLSGMLRFANETVGLLEISWLTPTKIRELYVTGERGMFKVDYLTQDLSFYENAAAGGLDWDAISVLRGVSEGSMTRFAIHKVEPLRAEQEAFLAAINGQAVEVASGRDAVEALKLALALIDSGQRHCAIELTASESGM